MQAAVDAAEDTSSADWALLPADLLQRIGTYLGPGSMCSGRIVCSSWAASLAAGVTTLRPLCATAPSLRKGSAWDVLGRLPALFPSCRVLDLRRCRCGLAAVQAAAAVGVATTVHMRLAITVSSVTKSAQCKEVRRVMAALARVAEAGGRQVWRLEFEVADLPFWWDNNLGDSDVRRMFGAVPPNALVERMNLTEHVMHNLRHKSLRIIASLTPLRELTLSNTAAISPSAFAELGALTNLTRLHLGAGFPISDTALADTLGRLRLLEVVTLVVLDAITDAGINLWPALGLPHLRYVGLHGFTGITDEVAASLHGIDGLRTVDLRNCTRVSDSGLARLARVPQLRLVDVRGCFRVTASGAATARATAGGRLRVVTGSDAFDAIPAALLGHEPSVRAGAIGDERSAQLLGSAPCAAGGNSSAGGRRRGWRKLRQMGSRIVRY